IVNTWATMLASVALAAFGAVQLYRERQRQNRVERAARAQLSASAYLLRRELRAWVGETASQGDDFEEWIQDIQNARRFAVTMNSAIERAYGMMMLLSEAPEHQGT